MPIIRPRLSQSQRAARLTFLKDVKQKRFWYEAISPVLNVPSLATAAISPIKVHQEDCWFDTEWQRRDTERRDQATAAYLQPPNVFPQNPADY